MVVVAEFGTQSKSDFGLDSKYVRKLCGFVDELIGEFNEFDCRLLHDIICKL